MSRLEVIKPEHRSEKFYGLCALGIMTKVPEAGKVKTRLTPPLTQDEAAAMNVCFLRDLSASITAAAEQSPATGVGIYTPVGKESAYDDILPQNFVLIPQRGNGFGERLQNAVVDLLAAGFASVCLINSDSPTVTAEAFAEAANELAKPGERLVLGPSDDGGYYLIGLKALYRRVFEEIDWSTERVFEQTVNRADEIAIPVHQLPTGFDVDDRITLQRLCDELLITDAPEGLAPNTRKVLTDIVTREGRDRIWPQVGGGTS